MNRGILFSSVDEDNKAISDYSRAIELMETDGGWLEDLVLIKRAEARARTGDYRDAIFDRSMALEIQIDYIKDDTGAQERYFENLHQAAWLTTYIDDETLFTEDETEQAFFRNYFKKTYIKPYENIKLTEAAELAKKNALVYLDLE
jgi:tetratricopeptide (TPR) repeat protein